MPTQNGITYLNHAVNRRSLLWNIDLDVTGVVLRCFPLSSGSLGGQQSLASFFTSLRCVSFHSWVPAVSRLGVPAVSRLGLYCICSYVYKCLFLHYNFLQRYSLYYTAQIRYCFWSLVSVCVFKFVTTSITISTLRNLSPLNFQNIWAMAVESCHKLARWQHPATQRWGKVCLASLSVRITVLSLTMWMSAVDGEHGVIYWSLQQ